MPDALSIDIFFLQSLKSTVIPCTSHTAFVSLLVGLVTCTSSPFKHCFQCNTARPAEVVIIGDAALNVANSNKTFGCSSI